MMHLSPQEFGLYMESLAQAYLELVYGWEMQEHRWRSGTKEIDLVMKTSEGDWVMIEVKGRRALRFGEGLELMTPAKQKHLLHAKRAYEKEKGKTIHQALYLFMDARQDFLQIESWPLWS